MKKIIILITCQLTMAIAAINAQSIKGKYRFMADGDGKTASAKAVILLSFSANTFTLKAEQPGSLVEDEGTYQVSGKNITLVFKTMEQGKKSGAFSLSNGVLTLPFQMLNNVNGSSTWQSAALVPENKITKEQIFEQAIAGAQKKAQWYAKLDARAQAAATGLAGGVAQAYYNQATLFYFKNFKWEALYGYAKAAQLQPQNGLYLNNFAQLLLELGRLSDAKVLLEEITKLFPNLAAPWGNLAYLYFKLGITSEAETAVKTAMRLAPDNGLYCYTWAKILEEKGAVKEAQTNFTKAWELGYAGNGREGGKPASSKTAAAGNSEPLKDAQIKKTGKKPGEEAKVEDWAGTYQAKYISARSGENAGEANTQFGQGVASTVMNLQTLACAKSFTMEISKQGSITGNGEIMYVYQGTTANIAAGMAPAALTGNGFSANLKNGYQIRPWQFSGTVDADGKVEITGLPDEKLDLLNVGKWQKITPWSPLLPDAAGAAMKGPFHLQLYRNQKKEPFIQVNQYLDLTDKLIKRVHYTALIIQSAQTITPDCRPLEAAPQAKCPASEFIKTKVSLSPRDHIAIETSNTYTKGGGGGVQTQTEMACNVSGDWSMGLATGSAEFHTDGSYEFTAGVGVEASLFGKASPVSLSNKLELVYDSKCGWGVKASAGTKAEGFGSSYGASVEGVIFFNKGL
jgi:tetratricopeptide (TPR) repeat protein